MPPGVLKSSLKASKYASQDTNKDGTTEQKRDSISLDALKGGPQVNFDKGLADSFSNLSHRSINDLSCSLEVKKKMSSEGIRWSDRVDTKRISTIRKSCFDNMFYSSEELADFRHEAFMEECGLDPAEFE